MAVHPISTDAELSPEYRDLMQDSKAKLKTDEESSDKVKNETKENG